MSNLWEIARKAFLASSERDTFDDLAFHVANCPEPPEFRAAREADERRVIDSIASRLREEADLCPCDEDAKTIRSCADLVEADFSYARAEEQAAAREADVEMMREARLALLGMLAHSCVADAGGDMKDEEDHAAERLARAILARLEERLK